MNTPAPLKKTNYDSRIFITVFVVNSVIANRIFNKMHGQALLATYYRSSDYRRRHYVDCDVGHQVLSPQLGHTSLFIANHL
jgi:hypothetical protein